MFWIVGIILIIAAIYFLAKPKGSPQPAADVEFALCGVQTVNCKL